MRQWLCCVVLRNVGLWLIFVAIIRTYPHIKKKKKETVTTRKIQNNEIITIRKSHTHTHIRTYIYVSIYVGCATFFSRESRAPWRESRTNRLQLNETEIWSPVKCRISNFLPSNVFLLKKAIIMFYIGRSLKGRRKLKISWVASRVRCNQKLSIFANCSESKLSWMPRSFAILILQLRKHESQSSW